MASVKAILLTNLALSATMKLIVITKLIGHHQEFHFLIGRM